MLMVKTLAADPGAGRRRSRSVAGAPQGCRCEVAGLHRLVKRYWLLFVAEAASHVAPRLQVILRRSGQPECRSVVVLHTILLEHTPELTATVIQIAMRHLPG